MVTTIRPYSSPYANKRKGTQSEPNSNKVMCRKEAPLPSPSPPLGSARLCLCSVGLALLCSQQLLADSVLRHYTLIHEYAVGRRICKGFCNGKKFKIIKNAIFDKITVQISIYYTQIEENSNILGLCFFNF